MTVWRVQLHVSGGRQSWVDVDLDEQRHVYNVKVSKELVDAADVTELSIVIARALRAINGEISTPIAITKES